MDAPWLTPAQQRAWRLFLRASAQIVDSVTHALGEEADLSLSEYEVLVRLSESPDHSVRMSYLAQDLVHSRSRTSYTVRRLEDRGLVKRTPAGDDGRGVTCTMTEEGFEALQLAAPGHVRQVRDRLIDRLNDDQVQQLGQIMGALLDDADLAAEDIARSDLTT